MTTPALHGFPDYQRSLSVADLQVTLANTAVAAGTFATIGPLDMRSYQSFQLVADCRGVAPITAYGRVLMTLRWTDDSAATNVVYQETWEWVPEGEPAVSNQSPFGTVQLHDAVHGPFLTVLIRNNGVDGMNVRGQVLGNSRSVPNLYVRNKGRIDQVQELDTDTLLVNTTNNTIAAVTAEEWSLPLAPGPAYYWFVSNAGAMNFTLITPDGTVWEQIGLAGAQARGTLYLPRAAIRLEVFNAGGLSSYTAHLTAAQTPGV